LVENVIWGEGLAKTSEYRHLGGSKIAQKNRHMIFERSLRPCLRLKYKVIIQTVM